MKTDWIFLDSTMKQNLDLKMGSDRMRVSLSPFDVPEALRGYHSDDGQFYIIEFRYLTDEPVKAVKRGDLVQSDVGVNSGRIYRIRIDIQELRKFVQAEVVKNVHGCFNPIPDNTDRLNRSYTIAREAIDANDTRLFGPLSGFYKKLVH